MVFIGIVTNKNNESSYRNEISNKLGNNINLIFINENNIESFRNISFSTILLCYDYSTIFKDTELIRKVVSNSKKFIVNTDIKSNYDILDSQNIDAITYGFNNKATITSSSNEDDVILCVQRNIINMEEQIIEPQDIKIIDNIDMVNVYEKIGLSILFLIYSKK